MIDEWQPHPPDGSDVVASRPDPSIEGSSASAHFVIGRQPIFDAGLDVRGFELLFRALGGPSPDSETMTADVLLHAGIDLGLDRLVGTKTAFVNASRAYLVGEREVPLPSSRTVIEVLEDVVHDDEVLTGCRRLIDQGFTLALDDYVWQPGDEGLLKLADIVKLDILAIPPADLAEQVDRCSVYGARLVAEKVETQEQFDTCRELGFELFQGYLLSRPVALSGQTLRPSRVNCLRLISKLCDPEISPVDVEQIIETDPGLSLRFLRAAGLGADAGLGRAVRSIREAAVLLGQRRLRSWATLMLLSAGDGVPEQLAITMTRARLCELVARSVAPASADSAFTVGLVAGLDLHLATSLEEIVSELGLDPELTDALLSRSGPLGAILSDVLDWEMGLPLRLPSGLSAAQMREMCAEALFWADELCHAGEATAVPG